jgi:molybdate transport system substrate-binding protein
VAVLAAGWMSGATAGDEPLRIAVAANFAAPAQTLAKRFESHTGARVETIVGSTGKLAAQIRHGAPFHALLAADSARPAELVARAAAVPGSQFTYALGVLVLWTPAAGRLGEDPPTTLAAGHFRRIAIANPVLAPYGEAARSLMEDLGLWSGLAPRVVYGESVGQAFAMVASGNAELGFVALSQILALPEDRRGEHWRPPAGGYPEIRQDAVLTRRGETHAAAAAFLEYLRSEAAAEVIRAYGYALPADR